MPTLQTILHGVVRAILVTFAITVIQTIRAIRAIRTVQAADVIREIRVVLVIRVIPAMRAVGAILAVWTMHAVRVARATRTILMGRVIPAIRAMAAAVAIRMTQTTRATRTILMVRVIPAARAIAIAIMNQMMQAIRAFRMTLVTRVLPALRALSAILAIRMMQAIRAIQTIPVSRLIQAMRANQMALAGRLIQAPQATRTILIRVTSPIRTICSTLAHRMVQATRAIPTVGAMQAIFSGSLAARAGILAVLVGAAAAYGMPERLPVPMPLPMSSTVLMSWPAPLPPPVTTGMTADDFNERFGSGRAASPVASPAGRPVATAPDRAALQSDNTEPAETRVAATPAPVQLAALPANPLPDEVSKSVEVQLPMPKPPLSPAQRLDLHGKDYDKAEKCLAQAIYFEARNEPARGQQAVAQVVLNRVFSPYYPKDVCSVVYQNAHRHLACQFTFACDGKPDGSTSAAPGRGPTASLCRP